MARGFGSTFGTGSTDSIQSGYTTAFSTNISIASWIWINGAGGGSAGRLYTRDGNNADELVGMNGASNVMKFGPHWTGGANFQWNAPSTGSWHHFVLTYNGGSTSNVPVVYIDGSSVSVTTLAAPSGTYSPTATALYIGNQPNGLRNWDGKVAEFALWDGAILTANEAKALYLGASPLTVRPASLKLYSPLFGLQANEQDWGPNRYSMTVTGALKQNHAPATAWMPARFSILDALRFTASLALAQGAHAAAISAAEKFLITIAPLQQAASAALAALEKFRNSLVLIAAPSLANILGHGPLAAATPGDVALNDMAVNGLACSDMRVGVAALSDTALYNLEITESI